MAKIARYVCLLLCIGYAGMLNAQGVHLVVHSIDQKEVVLNEMKWKTSFSNAIQCKEYVQQMPLLLQSKGYISASVDSFFVDSATAHAYIFTGEQYVWKQLIIDDKDVEALQGLGLRRKHLPGQVFNPQQVMDMQGKLMDFFEDNGYPFATLKYDSIVIDGKNISAKLQIDRGIFYRLDSIRIIGKARINKSFLYHYFNMQPGSGYSTEKLEKVNQRLLELPYLQQAQPWQINMLASSYLLDLYLQPKRSNQVDAIFGFLPENQQLGGKLLFTVDARIKLLNTFAAGESIALNWQQIQPKSPRLNIAFQQPYIFNSSFGLDFIFDFLKKDSSYLNLNAQIGLQYVLSAKQNGKVFLQLFNTNLLDVDTNTIKSTHQLPDMADLSLTNLGVQYEWSNTNYKFNPGRGNEALIVIAAGQKKIKKNSSITQIKDGSFDYNSLYDTVKLSTYQFKVQANGAQYFPLGRQSVLKTSLSAGLLQSGNYLRNELFQIGGYKLLRGFDEESIFCNRYAVATGEYRYLLGLNSYFAGFTDLGYTYNSISSSRYTYVGVGAGLAFEMKQGIFNISYAVGKRNDLPFSFRESKIHFGFVSIF